MPFSRCFHGIERELDSPSMQFAQPPLPLLQKEGSLEGNLGESLEGSLEGTWRELGGEFGGDLKVPLLRGI